MREFLVCARSRLLGTSHEAPTCPLIRPYFFGKHYIDIRPVGCMPRFSASQRYTARMSAGSAAARTWKSFSNGLDTRMVVRRPCA